MLSAYRMYVWALTSLHVFLDGRQIFYVVEGLPEAVADGFLSARHTEDQIRTSERRILDECGYRRLGMYVGATSRTSKNDMHRLKVKGRSGL